MKRKLLQFFGLGALSGCVGAQGKSRSVTTVLFNYTNRYIADVVVDGAWVGGADGFSEGGGAQGLLAPSDPSRRAVLQVSWHLSGLYDIEKDEYSRVPIEQRQAEVPVAWPYPTNPVYLVLHFYSDGRVESELEANRPQRRIPPPPGYHR